VVVPEIPQLKPALSGKSYKNAVFIGFFATQPVGIVQAIRELLEPKTITKIKRKDKK